MGLAAASAGRSGGWAMSGRLAPDPEATVSIRYYGPGTTEHLDRLAGLAAVERERFARRCTC